MQPPIIQFSDSGLDSELRKEVMKFLGEETRGGVEIYKTTAILFVFFLSWYLIPFFVTVPPCLLIFAYALLEGLTTASIGMAVMHDANHGSYSKNQKLNEQIGRATLRLLGADPDDWNMQHNFIHHTYTNSKHDDDLGFGNLFRFSPNQEWKPHHRFQHLYAPILYPLMTILWITTKDFDQVRRYNKEGRTGFENLPERLKKLRISKALYYGFWLILPLIFWQAGFWVVVLSFIGKHLVSGFTLAIIFQPAHVSSVAVFPSELKFRNRTEYQIMTSCNFAMKNKFITRFSGGLNFQIEHHLFPYISHVHYPDIAPIVQRHCKRNGITYNDLGSFGDAIKDHFRHLRELGKKKPQLV